MWLTRGILPQRHQNTNSLNAWKCSFGNQIQHRFIATLAVPRDSYGDICRAAILLQSARKIGGEEPRPTEVYRYPAGTRPIPGQDNSICGAECPHFRGRFAAFCRFQAILQTMHKFDTWRQGYLAVPRYLTVFNRAAGRSKIVTCNDRSCLGPIALRT